MEREEAIKILKAIRVYECYPKSASEETKEAIDMAIEALSEPIWDENREIILGVATFDELMDSDRTGEWIYSTKQLEIVPMWECSCCRIRAAKKFNFCPHCGADMRGEQDGNV